MKRSSIIAFLICMATLVYQSELYAYSASVHQRMTKELIAQNEGGLNQYLRNIGLSGSLTEYLNGKSIKDWMIAGSWMEDLGADILTSHFYDPLTNRGYSVLGVEIGQSAYDSANDLSNYGAWVWARKRLYDGLTQTDKTTRQQYLGIAFLALGRAMHLVQDVAVPAHTRNDGHMPGVDSEPYEDYTNKHLDDFVYTSVPFPYWNVSVSAKAPRQFWDLDSYDGSTVYTSGYIGLAEYTNPNFFSKNTIFKDYPHPSYVDTNYPNINWTHPEIVDAEDGIFDSRIYISKSGGESVNHLAAISYISYDVIKKGYYQYSPFVLDDACHNEYAEKLLSRAVGYSAGLLNYFFRGNIAVSEIKEQTANQTVTGVSVKLTNLTPNEEMKDGEFRVSYRYKLTGATEYSYGLSDPVPSGNLTYGAEAPYQFAFPSPIPAGGNDVQYTLVFKGTLGQEVEAVAGQVFQPGWEDWERGFNGRHNWTVFPANSSANVVATTTSDPLVTGNIVAEFQVATYVNWEGDFINAWLDLSGAEGSDKMLSTDEFSVAETSFYVKNPPSAFFYPYLSILLEDPVTGAHTYADAPPPCNVNGCHAGGWYPAYVNLPSGYVIKGVSVYFVLSTNSPQTMDFLMNDIVFWKR